MSWYQVLILVAVAIGVGWIILQPQRWGKRDRGYSDGGSTTVGIDASGRRGDRDNDHDGDGGDGGGGD